MKANVLILITDGTADLNFFLSDRLSVYLSDGYTIFNVSVLGGMLVYTIIKWEKAETSEGETPLGM